MIAKPFLFSNIYIHSILVNVINLNALHWSCSFTDDLQGGIRCKAFSRKFADWLTSPELGASLQQFVDEGEPIFTGTHVGCLGIICI